MNAKSSEKSKLLVSDSEKKSLSQEDLEKVAGGATESYQVVYNRVFKCNGCNEERKTVSVVKHVDSMFPHEGCPNNGYFTLISQEKETVPV